MENIVYVYNKHNKLLAQFDGNTEGLSDEEKKNLMVSPMIHIETNGESTLSFQMLVNSYKWQQIKDPENIYFVNGRYYTALNDNSYQFLGEESVRIVNVTLPEIWYLLDRKYTQIYNCAIYTAAKARFVSYTEDGGIFTINAADCFNTSESISRENAWTQVKNWNIKDDDDKYLSFAVLKDKEHKPTNWEKAPSAVNISNISISGDTATITVKARASQTINKTFDYSSSGEYRLEATPVPSKIKGVHITSTTQTSDGSNTIFTTSTKEITTYSYSNNIVNVRYSPAGNETVASVVVQYDYYDIGEIKEGATCTIAYGAEVVDEHTVLLLPKSDPKYKLTINGVEYEDSEVRDARGVIMPRGSAGYAMWAVLKDSGWQLGICDVIAKDFDPSIDYGCFNIESDMKDILYNIQYIQELYGGILDWDSEHKILNYRAENSEDYDAYDDGFNRKTGYEFRNGKNMAGEPDITVDNKLITKGYLLGYGGLNVKKVNDNKSYVTDFTFTDAVYEGYLEQPLIYDTNDDGGQKQLLYWGQKEIHKQSRPRKTISVTCRDVRTTQGFEHEVFDINDIVRVYYLDSDTGEEVYEEKRIILWEYNAFAMYESTVEVGDKTQNFSELFKLIYNKSVEDAPSTNASGNISSEDLVLIVPNYDGYYGYEGGYGGGGFGGGGGLVPEKLSDYLELLVQVTTENTDAIGGLRMYADETQAWTEQFSQFTKQTDSLFSQTYAGLTTYADDVGSAVQLIAEGYYNENKEKIGNVETTVSAGFEAQQTQNEAFTSQFSRHNTRITNTETGLVEQRTALSEFKTYATDTFATAEQLSEFETETGKNIASVRTYADQLSSKIDLVANNVSGIYSRISVYDGGVSISSYNGSSSYASFTGSRVSINSPDVVQIYAGGRLNLIGGAQIWATGTINGTCTNANYATNAGYATIAGSTSYAISATGIQSYYINWRYSTELSAFVAVRGNSM